MENKEWTLSKLYLYDILTLMRRQQLNFLCIPLQEGQKFFELRNYQTFVNTFINPVLHYYGSRMCHISI